jgi:DNA-binding NtrC family response regulator/predicted hydrocarbon binding protein
MPTEDARILLDGKRMALIHGQALGSLRREMIDSIGIEASRGLFTRMGYASGKQDGETARRLSTELEFPNAFLFGPHFYTLEGLARTEVMSIEIDLNSGCYRGEFTLQDSLEVETHLRDFGDSDCPVCWMQTGYASGYMTTFIGRPIPHKEASCRGMGADVCRVVGKPLDEWGADFIEESAFYGSEAFTFYGSGSARGFPAKKRGEKSPRLRSGSSANTPSRKAHEIVGVSPAILTAIRLIRKVAKTQVPVLILGETGVGKELFAKELHAQSERAEAPFIAVNCAAIPATLVEAELFGVEEGAYTGANVSRPGRFERADHGTLFLDEVGSLSLSSQGALLRALQTGEIERVGTTRVRQVDVRLVSATNEDLEKKIAAGTFRSDLFYRLNLVPVRIPPLRERREDVPLLVSHFLAKFNRVYQRAFATLSEDAMKALLERDYPGNVRELANDIERAVILSADDGPLDTSFLCQIEAQSRDSFDDGFSGRTQPTPGFRELLRAAVQASSLTLDDLEHAIMETAVEASSGNLAAAARRIGVTRRRLAYRLRTAPPRSSA